jgi:hypothetical protein
MDGYGQCNAASSQTTSGSGGQRAEILDETSEQSEKRAA